MVKKKNKTAAFLLASFVLLAPSLPGMDQQANDLEARYKAALSKNDVELAVSLVCDAAKLNPKKYDKRCMAEQHHANEQMKAFDSFFTAGQTAMQQKDYAGAIRQFGRIAFGLRRDDAQHLIQEAKIAEGHPQALIANRQDLATAQAAYDRGDLNTAEASAKLVQVIELQPLAQQILTNIHIYQDAMKAGDLARQNGDYQAAQQKYKFAMAIRPNGPGDPAGKLQQIGLLVAVSTITKQAPPAKPIAGEIKKPDLPLNDAGAKVKAALADGHAAEVRKDVDAALQAYERVLAINPRQADAIAGRQRVLDSVRMAPQGLENTLSLGLHSYYRSQLAEAGDAISLYLTAGGTRNRGVAYFYLGATFASEALLTDAHALVDRSGWKSMRCSSFSRPVASTTSRSNAISHPRFLLCGIKVRADADSPGVPLTVRLARRQQSAFTLNSR